MSARRSACRRWMRSCVNRRANRPAASPFISDITSYYMQATVKWTDGRQFVAESGSGHSVVIDGPPDHGGRNTGPRPMEMLLMGLGACASFDILEILEKSRAEATGCVAAVEAERADAVPAVFTKIHVHFTV